MYGLAYCKLDYEYMYELDINILSKLLKAEIDKELHDYDVSMRKLAWQTSYLMNATGNYKNPVKPEKLYTSIFDKTKKAENKKPLPNSDIQKKRDELLKTFGIKE